jgi:hypothetical protein
MSVTIIFRDIPVGDMWLAVRAAKWLILQPLTQKDAILCYGSVRKEEGRDFYVRRNKASITVRPCK